MRSHGESIPAHVYVLYFKCGDRCRVAGHSFAGIEPLDEWPNVKVSRTLGYVSSHVITTCALYVRVGLGRSVLGTSSSSDRYACPLNIIDRTGICPIRALWSHDVFWGDVKSEFIKVYRIQVSNTADSGKRHICDEIGHLSTGVDRV